MNLIDESKENKFPAYYLTPNSEAEILDLILNNLYNSSKSKNKEENNNLKREQRSLTTCGDAEFGLPPDQVKLIVLISSVKQNLDDAKSSVQKRFDYVFQTMKKRLKISDSDLNVVETLNSKEGGKSYELTKEISTVLNDVNKYLEYHNFLVEKLGKSVTFGQPFFSYSKSRMFAIK
jgi:hypothetical protein